MCLPPGLVTVLCLCEVHTFLPGEYRTVSFKKKPLKEVKGRKWTLKLTTMARFVMP